MSFDYASLFVSEDGITDTWRELYDDNLLLPENFLSLLRRTVYLPCDFYDIVAAYALLPSALCKNIPYLFLCGTSGSGKSTIAKLISHLHGVKINSSSDSYAGIRNDLDKRRRTIVERVDPEDPTKTYRIYGEANTCMVWDDVDASVFINSPDIYRLFKFGSNRASAIITISSKEVGENLEFNTFCPKVFSSISPLHLDDRFKELRRRLIVIPCKKLEDISELRKAELGIVDNQLRGDYIDIDAYDWKGFSSVYKDFWDLNLAKSFIDNRKVLVQSLRGLSSTQRAVSLDLLAGGIAAGIWSDENIGIHRIKEYWKWFKEETEKNTGLIVLLRDYVKQLERNSKTADIPLSLPNSQLRNQVNNWVATDWLLENPRASELKAAMFDLGMRLHKGIWSKG